ncbi:hypothetical protein IRZ59_21810 [Pseudomonas guariconensis]|uniref:hypothetical protein n=1 Tax=Pseudomonas guariconensis TaxID=1288410 RepID=UPI0018A988FA|nr:hypothetical protein [Pseudomonas guariconensis]MBF8733069.1 hypothetical protein [Pseudomonas guariconensis]
MVSSTLEGLVLGFALGQHAYHQREVEMKVKSDLSGLKKLQENMEKLQGSHEVPLSDVITAEFVSTHSRFKDFDTLLATIGVTTKEEFLALDDEEFDAFIAENTDFESWLDMQQKAMAEYARARLMAGLKG